MKFGVRRENQPNHNLSEIYIMPFINASYILALAIKSGILSFFECLSKNALYRFIKGAGIVALVTLNLPGRPGAAAELNIYSHRQPFLIKPFIDAYRAKTGTNIICEIRKTNGLPFLNERASSPLPSAQRILQK